jgi:type IX secretion system PorP/SprF family membrane protein
MNTMRRIPLFLLTIPISIGVWAQQLPQLSQYVSQDYLYNPAVAGSRPLFEIRSAHRSQWVGIQDAPRTFMLSTTTPVGANMGVGGFLYTDHVGPTRRTGFQASYAYHLKLTSEIKLGLALSFGLQQFLIDGSKITFHDGYDPVMDDQLRGDLVPDATFGLLLHHRDWWFGAAAPQILGNTVYFFDDRDESLNSLARHYYAMGGYRYHVSEDLSLEPSFLVKYVDPVPAKIDATVMVRYKEMVWLGASYRTNDAISVMVGYWMKRTLQFGYSYDVITTNLSRYSTGTHELMLAVTFGKERPTDPTPAPASAAPTPTQ